MSTLSADLQSFGSSPRNPRRGSDLTPDYLIMPKSKEIVSSSDSDSDQPKPKKKKADKGATSDKKKSSSTKGPNGEAMFEIGRMRYATVSEFKGKTLVSIREYYMTDNGDLRPGKKGISLPVDQWNALKDVIPEVDKAVQDL